MELPLIFHSKFRFKMGVSEISANILISFALISMIITMYTLGFNYTSLLYKRGEMSLVEDFAIFLARGLNNMFFRDESRVFDSDVAFIVFKAKNYSTLLVNGVVLGSWEDFEISIYPKSRGFLGNETIILYGNNDAFSSNETNFCIMSNGQRIVLKFNVKISLLNGHLFIKVYSLKNEETISATRFLVRVSSIHRLFYRLHVPSEVLRFSLFHGSFSESFSLKLYSPFISILFEIIEFEVDEA